MMSSTARDVVLLVSELFPPAVGGSAVLFQGIYSRLNGTDVRVLTDEKSSPAAPMAPSAPIDDLRVLRRSIATRRWGILDAKGLAHHVRVGLQIRALMPRGGGLVHVARALPEGVAAWLGRALGGPDFVCWAHGEDLATASSSRELTFVTRQVYGAARAAIANSRNTAALLNTFGVPDEKITVVYPAVDARRFHPAVDGSQIRQRYAGPDDILLLSVGRLQRRKGHDVTIEAIDALRDEVPQLRYVIAGNGDERGRLESLVNRFALNDRVFFADVVADSELPAYYAACDVFVMPNRIDDRDIEGFGIVFLEAAAAGKPSIGGDSGGVPEAVERNVTGLLVDGTKASEVARAIRQLSASRYLRLRLGAAGRERVERLFTWQRAAASVLELHHRLTSDSMPPS